MSRRVEVIRAEEFGIESVPGELRWFTLCTIHGDTSGHPTKKHAQDWAKEPTMWCYGCQEEAE